MFIPFLWVIGFQLVSYGIGLVTRANMGWYDTLEKSTLTPPDIAFPIVWSILYVLMALAGYQVWTKCAKTSLVFILFWVQMALNWAWSFVFFGAQEIGLGFYWIVVLDLVLAAFLVVAWRSARIAAVLAFPTLVWGAFAGYLSYVIMMMN